MTFSRAFWWTAVAAAAAPTLAPRAVSAEVHVSRAPIYLENGACERGLAWRGGKLSIKGKDRSVWDVTNMELVDDNGVIIPECNKDQMAILCVYDRDTKKLVHPLKTRFKPCMTSLQHADKPSASPSPETRKVMRPLGSFGRTILHHVIDIEIVP